jgi:copper chaperone
MTTSTYQVTGMTCSHCVSAVTAEVSQVPGVTKVEIDLASGRLTVAAEGPLDESVVAAAVDEAGYQLAGSAC